MHQHLKVLTYVGSIVATANTVDEAALRLKKWLGNHNFFSRNPLLTSKAINSKGVRILTRSTHVLLLEMGKLLAIGTMMRLEEAVVLIRTWRPSKTRKGEWFFFSTTFHHLRATFF